MQGVTLTSLMYLDLGIGVTSGCDAEGVSSLKIGA